MNDIPVEAQQRIVDSIKNQACKFPQVVLCHSSGLLSSDVQCKVCTHDKFEKRLLKQLNPPGLSPS